jgi:replication factor A1
MLIGDWTSNRWVTCFTELAEQLFQKSSQEIGEASETSPTVLDEIFSNITFQDYVFKLRTKVEFYGVSVVLLRNWIILLNLYLFLIQDAPRAKTSAITAVPVNYKEFNAYLIKNLTEMTGISKPAN